MRVCAGLLINNFFLQLFTHVEQVYVVTKRPFLNVSPTKLGMHFLINYNNNNNEHDKIKSLF